MKKTLLFAVPVLAVCGFAACGHDSSTGPSKVAESAGPFLSAPDIDGDTDAEPSTEAFTSEFSRIRSDVSRASHDVSIKSEWGPGPWYLDILRAPKSGTSFKVNIYGMFPKPEPKFRFKVTVPVDLVDPGILVYFLTSGNRQCGFGLIKPSANHDFHANQSKTLDIAQDMIMAGPYACSVIGTNCSSSQCKYPLTTTKIGLLFGNHTYAYYDTFDNIKYTWKR